MPRKEVTERWLYKYSELPDKAKQKALEEVRNWNYEGLEPEFITENLENDLHDFYGIESGTKDRIYWESCPFWACFSGSADWRNKDFLEERGPKDLLGHRNFIHELATKLDAEAWGIGSIYFKGNDRYGGISECEVSVDEPLYHELEVELRDFFETHEVLSPSFHRCFM